LEGSCSVGGKVGRVGKVGKVEAEGCVGGLCQAGVDGLGVVHLRRVAEAQLRRAGYMTWADFFRFMDAAGFGDREVILGVLGGDSRVEISDGGFRWVEGAT